MNSVSVKPERVAVSVAIIVNDEPRSLNGDATIAALASELGLTDRKGVAIAVNGSVVPRSAWSTHALSDGDRVLVIRATQGG
jgi:sulfur carrier protein